MNHNFNCIVCGRVRLQEIEKFNSLPRVTSDCKPFPAGGRLFVCGDCGGIQKAPDASWFGDIRKIYEEYEIYQLSDGAEQLIFTDLGVVPRSQRLVDFLKSATALSDRGRLIDIGCGNGAALARFSKALPDWQLYGSELSDRALPRLQSMSNFIELYTVPINEIVGHFDLVSMIHSLEHMPSPRSTLEHTTRLLTENGVLFIEVPDVETSPFDLLVVDHLAHFSRDTLRYLVAQVGLSVSFIGNSVLPKEITLLAKVARSEVAAPAAQASVQMALASVLWLDQLLGLARDMARTQKFGIFGTSISGMWLFGPLSNEVSFFVDEDPNRIGREYAGKPILSPLDVPSGSTVFIPLAPVTAEKIAERYANSPARFVPSPPFAHVSVAK